MDQNVLQNVKLSYKTILVRTLIEDKDNSLPLKLKKVTIKDVIYWVTDSRDLNQQRLRKCWQKLWPSLTYVNSPDQKIKETIFLSLYNVLLVVKKQMLIMLMSGC